MEFTDQTGIVTGDVSINPHASMLIMTTEILRNRLLTDSSSSAPYSWVIFDEIHYIDEPERGTVWEECLMFLPPGIKFLGLSATLPNITEFASWISFIRGEDVAVVTEERRPVPLKFYFVSGRKVSTNPETLARKHERPAPSVPRQGKINKLPGNNDIIHLISGLRSRDRLPAIYFTMNRKRTVSLAESLTSFDFLDETGKKEIDTIIRNVYGGAAAADNHGFDDILPFLRKGIAYHHAGMLPTTKELVEKLFASGLIRIIFTTSTFSLGINMPARSVILDELRRRSGRSFRIIPKRDFFQMGGRAGRRGIDEIGYVYSFIDRSIRPHTVRSLITGLPEPVSSRFDLSYAGILNLYETYGENIYSVYFKSFKYFQEKTKSGSREPATGLRKKLNVLKDLGYIDSGHVSEAGKFAREVHGYELPVGELFKGRIMDMLYPRDMIFLALALVYEPKPGEKSVPEHNRSKYLHKISKAAISRIHRAERKFDVNGLSPSFTFTLSTAADLWVRKEPFYWCVYNSGIDEGDLVRYFRMAIQILRELLNTRPEGKVRSKIENAISLLNRDLIDAERELRGEHVGDQGTEEEF
jgi:superfamily II RNA helicase